jgi:hypothetical protein
MKFILDIAGGCIETLAILSDDKLASKKEGK